MAHGESLRLAKITGPHYYNLQAPGAFHASLGQREKRARVQARIQARRDAADAQVEAMIQFKRFKQSLQVNRDTTSEVN